MRPKIGSPCCFSRPETSPATTFFFASPPPSPTRPAPFDITARLVSQPIGTGCWLARPRVSNPRLARRGNPPPSSSSIFGRDARRGSPPPSLFSSNSSRDGDGSLTSGAVVPLTAGVAARDPFSFPVVGSEKSSRRVVGGSHAAEFFLRTVIASPEAVLDRWSGWSRWKPDAASASLCQ
ncbi:unnamed protein product [Linum trigynum]|uniref:Uncharacterized protein n=1 Tax=Linum trigynum TaxID=586398 RepID=A0AAV2CC26_9ROSI